MLSDRPSSPPRSPIHKVLDSVNSGVTGAVEKVGEGANAVGGNIKSGLDAGMEGTKVAASKVGEGSKTAFEALLKAIRGALTHSAQFQAVFSSTIDKSDEGLKKAFDGVDANSSGQISGKEMNDYIAKVYGGYAVPTPDSSASHNCSPLPALASQII